MPPWLRDLGLVLLAVIALRAWQQRDMPRGEAPPLRGRDLSGADVDLSQYRGAPVVVHFWATWCGVCEAEAPNIQALAKDAPVVTVAASSGSAAQVQAYMDAGGLSFTTLNDPTGTLAHRFGVRAFPTSFVLDADGHIAHTEVGYTTELGLRVRLWLAGL